ncbi:MAG: hypothetical protein KDD70_08885 [Bdellovibrionales bacterium]|nr:hypothetical protein [Bdellovibrionales bacterium]
MKTFARRFLATLTCSSLIFVSTASAQSSSSSAIIQILESPSCPRIEVIDSTRGNFQIIFGSRIISVSNLFAADFPYALGARIEETDGQGAFRGVRFNENTQKPVQEVPLPSQTLRGLGLVGLHLAINRENRNSLDFLNESLIQIVQSELLIFEESGASPRNNFATFRLNSTESNRLGETELLITISEHEITCRAPSVNSNVITLASASRFFTTNDEALTNYAGGRNEAVANYRAIESLFEESLTREGVLSNSVNELMMTLDGTNQELGRVNDLAMRAIEVAERENQKVRQLTAEKETLQQDKAKLAEVSRTLIKGLTTLRQNLRGTSFNRFTKKLLRRALKASNGGNS